MNKFILLKVYVGSITNFGYFTSSRSVVGSVYIMIISHRCGISCVQSTPSVFFPFRLVNVILDFPRSVQFKMIVIFMSVVKENSFTFVFSVMEPICSLFSSNKFRSALGSYKITKEWRVSSFAVFAPVYLNCLNILLVSNMFLTFEVNN